MARLEDRIKQIMEGTSKPEALQADAGLSAKEVASKQNKIATSGDPEGKDSSKQNEVLRSESVTPDTGLKVGGTDTTAAADNAKIQSGKGRKLDSDGTKLVQDGASADQKTDNTDADNTKIKAKQAGTKEASGKLTQESMSALFSGEELSEEFKEKASTIFEAAVEHVAEARIQELQEEHQLQLSEAVEEVKGELVEQIDGFLDKIVEQWLQDNVVALERGMKMEVVESFIQGIKQVFTEHYVEVPEDKVDIVEAQASEIEALQAQVAELAESVEAVQAEKQILQCEDIVAESSKGLTAIESEKFASLVENVEFTSVEEFTSKVQTIRESYFKKGSQPSSQEVTKQLAEEKQAPSSTAKAVVEALNKGTLKFVRQ